MSVPRSEIQTLNPGSLWVGFKLDCSVIGGEVYYLSAHLNALGNPVVWQGNEFTPMPIMGSGFEASTNGTLPRPTITVSNLDGLVGALVGSLDDLTGAIVTRKQVLVKYLDAENFAAGNANADPTAGYEDDIWVVEQKTGETREGLTFELVAASDALGLMLPARQVQDSVCTHSYANADGSGLCPYTGELPTCNRSLDDVNGCRAHFPTGGLYSSVFPGSRQVG